MACPAIRERMNRYSSSETHFALLSIQQKRSSILKNQIELLNASLSTSGNDGSIQEQLTTLNIQLENELSNQERQRQENIRRRHNYIPFAISLLRNLSKKGLLQGLIDKAKSAPKKRSRIR